MTRDEARDLAYRLWQIMLMRPKPQCMDEAAQEILAALDAEDTAPPEEGDIVIGRDKIGLLWIDTYHEGRLPHGVRVLMRRAEVEERLKR